MRARLNSDGGQMSPGVNADPQFGELVYGGGTAFTSGSSPTAEAVKGTGVAAGETFGCVLSATDGTIVIDRPGNYLVILDLGDAEATTGDGTFMAEVLKAPASAPSTFAAFTKRMRASFVADETGLVNLSASRVMVKQLKKGDVLEVALTGTSSGALVINEGGLTVVQLTDEELTVTA